MLPGTLPASHPNPEVMEHGGFWKLPILPSPPKFMTEVETSKAMLVQSLRVVSSRMHSPGAQAEGRSGGAKLPGSWTCAGRT